MADLAKTYQLHKNNGELPYTGTAGNKLETSPSKVKIESEEDFQGGATTAADNISSSMGGVMNN